MHIRLTSRQADANHAASHHWNAFRTNYLIVVGRFACGMRTAEQVEKEYPHFTPQQIESLSSANALSAALDSMRLGVECLNVHYAHYFMYDFKHLL